MNSVGEMSTDFLRKQEAMRLDVSDELLNKIVYNDLLFDLNDTLKFVGKSNQDYDTPMPD